jgi:hypothetical protein
MTWELQTNNGSNNGSNVSYFKLNNKSYFLLMFKHKRNITIVLLRQLCCKSDVLLCNKEDVKYY